MINSICKKDIQFIRLCIQASEIFSTCSKKKYAAFLVDCNNHIVGFGYNGGPSGFTHCDDGGCPRLLHKSESGSLYDDCIAIHAEANAFLHSNYNSNPEKIYINGPPCFSCAKLIANSTVSKVFYIKDQSYKQWREIEMYLNKANVVAIEMSNACF